MAAGAAGGIPRAEVHRFRNDVTGAADDLVPVQVVNLPGFSPGAFEFPVRMTESAAQGMGPGGVAGNTGCGARGHGGLNVMVGGLMAEDAPFAVQLQQVPRMAGGAVVFLDPVKRLHGR